MKKITKIALLFITTVIPQLSFAASTQTNLTVSSNLESSCSLKINDVSFTNLILKNDSNKLEILNILCTLSTTYSLNIMSENPIDNNLRSLTDGTPNSDIITYQILLPGNGPFGNTTFFNSTGTGLTQYQWLSFLILRGQYVKPGIYSDKLTINVNY